MLERTLERGASMVLACRAAGGGETIYHEWRHAHPELWVRRRRAHGAAIVGREYDQIMLRQVIIVLAIADGVLHLALKFVLFRGNFFGALPFPSPFPLPLNYLFSLNFVGYVVLAVAFWYAPRLLGRRRWLVDVVLLGYTVLTILGWVRIGMPNPRGLGYLSKALELALLVALALHAWRVIRPDRPVRRAR